jgi:hypothetical protein
MITHISLIQSFETIFRSAMPKRSFFSGMKRKEGITLR